MTNPIPSLRAAGKFEAKPPFDQVVDVNVHYSVEAIRTIPEMEGLKLDLYERVYAPANITELDYNTLISVAKAAKAAIITIVDRKGNRVNVPTNYLKSFPLVDGVSYERICMVVDLGPCPPNLLPSITDINQHFKSYAEANLGLENVAVKLGTVPTIGYVSKEQHEAYELARLGNIQVSKSDVAVINQLEEQLILKDDYIERLEQALEAHAQTNNPDVLVLLDTDMYTHNLVLGSGLSTLELTDFVTGNFTRIELRYPTLAQSLEENITVEEDWYLVDGNEDELIPTLDNQIGTTPLPSELDPLALQGQGLLIKTEEHILTTFFLETEESLVLGLYTTPETTHQADTNVLVQVCYINETTNEEVRKLVNIEFTLT